MSLNHIMANLHAFMHKNRLITRTFLSIMTLDFEFCRISFQNFIRNQSLRFIVLGKTRGLGPYTEQKSIISKS